MKPFNATGTESKINSHGGSYWLTERRKEPILYVNRLTFALQNAMQLIPTCKMSSMPGIRCLLRSVRRFW